MAYNFICGDRDQLLLLPQDMRDWLPGKHLVFFMLDIVSQLNLSEFRRFYNPDGVGNAAYDPSMMVALYFYSYCVGERSSRKIEELCRESVPYRVVSGGLQPDHSTISRFRKRFEKELAALFLQVLPFCCAAGLCDVAVVAVDGTKMKANAAMAKNRTESGLKKDIERYLREADMIDAEEDRLYGPDKPGKEIPPEYATREKRINEFRKYQKQLAQEKQKLVEEHQARIDKRKEQEAETGAKKRGRKPKSIEKVEKDAQKKLKVNLTDPDSRIMKTASGYLQGFNCQAAVSSDQIVVAAELTQDQNDVHQLIPMLEKTIENLKTLEENMEIGTFLGDAGYFSEKNLRQLGPDYPDVILAVTKEWKTLKAQRGGNIIPLPVDLKTAMEYRLLTPEGRELYSKRKIMPEPVFGQMKEVSGFRGFMRRGEEACACEWKMICTAHNLLKLWRYGVDKVHRKTAAAVAMAREIVPNTLVFAS